MRVFLFLFLSCFFLVARSQEVPGNYRSKKVIAADSVLIDSVSINPSYFKIQKKNGVLLDSTYYHIDFKTGILTLKKRDFPIGDTLFIEYLRFPDYLTKTYQGLDPNLIVKEGAKVKRKYALKEERHQEVAFFDGLNTSGSLSRGVTVGNNQNAVVNSQLDLQISGKLSEKVTLTASIKDANIPLQENGYSQRLDEFDQIFINLEGPSWNVRAGDVNLRNTSSYFMGFEKKIQGISLETTLQGSSGKTTALAAGALVRGNFAQSQFTGQEGNQGPYKLQGPNGELFILIVSGSERVFVNGIQLTRGENNDYVIDYNAGELSFTARHPITSDMRILVEYQYTNNNYTRFLTYGGLTHQRKKFSAAAYFYSETDSKNQPLQQNLSQTQVDILRAAGDDKTRMLAPSAIPDSFSENKVLYKKLLINGVEVFEFSTNPEEELFQVRFSNVGTGQGNYILSNNNTIGKIYAYIPPVNGIPQGDFEPVVQLTAPDKFQMGIVNAQYNPSDNTNVFMEGAWSNKDLNLFSTLDDINNHGLAARLAVKQQLFDNKWKGALFGTYDYVDKNFRNLEGLYNIEFNRDWNLPFPSGNQLQNSNGALGNQTLMSVGMQITHPKKGLLNYTYKHLRFKEFGSGNKHSFRSELTMGPVKLRSQNSYLENTTPLTSSSFFKTFSKLSYFMKKSWAGIRVLAERNKQKDLSTQRFTPISQQYQSYNPFIGIGDSTKLFLELGYQYRTNDSVRNNRLQRFNTSNTYYLNSALINTKTSQLNAYISYRDFKYENNEKEKSLNSRVLYHQKLFNKTLLLNTAYETLSGTIAQQEFSYLEVEPGQGAYTWVDYNNNGIQELDEFELAQFQDEGKYVRILLPNRVFVPTHQNKFSQTLVFNFASWENASGFKKTLSRFYNQMSYLIDRKEKRAPGRFDINPFSTNNSNLLGLNRSFRNIVFFNRGKQRFSTSYTYLSTNTKNQLSFGAQQNKTISHQLQFIHKFHPLWLLNITASDAKDTSISENFISRNFSITGNAFEPKISYLFNLNSRFEVFYNIANKKNTGQAEDLLRYKAGASFAFTSGQKYSITGEFNYFNNHFKGNPFTPAGYQMLEGLQPGNNFTWNLLIQKKITRFLDLNAAYFGRKSESSKAIHTGSIQLKAYF